MTHPTAKELNKVITPFMQKHLTPVESASIKEWNSGHPDLINTGKDLMEEAKVLMASGDATSAAAMDFARRFRVLTNEFKSSPTPMAALKPKLKAVVDDVRSDPQASQKMEVFGFIEKAMANLKAQEGNTESKA